MTDNNVEFLGNSKPLVEAINQAVEAWKKYIAMGGQLGAITAKMTDDGIKVSAGFRKTAQDGTVLKSVLTGLVGESKKFVDTSEKVNVANKKNAATYKLLADGFKIYLANLEAANRFSGSKGVSTGAPSQSVLLALGTEAQTTERFAKGEALKLKLIQERFAKEWQGQLDLNAKIEQAGFKIHQNKLQLIYKEQSVQKITAQSLIDEATKRNQLRLSLDTQLRNVQLQTIKSREAAEARLAANIQRFRERDAASVKKLAAEELASRKARQAALRSEYLEKIKLEQAFLQQARSAAQQRVARRSVEGVTAGPLSVISAGASPAQLLNIQAQKVGLEQLAAQAGLTQRQFNNLWGRVAQGQVEGFRGKQLQVAQAMQGMQGTLSKTGEGFKTLGQHIGGVLVSWQSMIRLMTSQVLLSQMFKLLNYMREGVRTAQEFSIRIAEIRTISQDADFSTERWTNSLVELSNAFGIGIIDQAKAAYQALSDQVVKAAEVTEFLNTVNKFSIATVASATDSQNLLGAAIKSFGLEASDAERVAATFFKTIEVGRVIASDMAVSFGRVAVVAAEAGASLEELQATISVLTVRGLKYSEASTQLRGIFLKLIKPTKEMKAVFAELNVETAKQGIELFGLGGFLSFVAERTEGAADETAKLFNNIRGLTGALILSGDGLADYNKNLKEIRNSFTDYDRAVKLVLESEGQQVKILFNELKNFFTVELGQNFIKALVFVNKNIFNIVSAVESLVKVLGLSLIPVIAKAIGVAIVRAQTARAVTLALTQQTIATAATAKATAVLTRAQIAQTAAAQTQATASKQVATAASGAARANIIILGSLAAAYGIDLLIRNHYKRLEELEKRQTTLLEARIEHVRAAAKSEVEIQKNALIEVVQAYNVQSALVRKSALDYTDSLSEEIKQIVKDTKDFLEEIAKDIERAVSDSVKAVKTADRDIEKLDSFVQKRGLQNQKDLLNSKLANARTALAKIKILGVEEEELNKQLVAAKDAQDADLVLALLERRRQLYNQLAKFAADDAKNDEKVLAAAAKGAEKLSKVEEKFTRAKAKLVEELEEKQAIAQKMWANDRIKAIGREKTLIDLTNKAKEKANNKEIDELEYKIRLLNSNYASEKTNLELKIAAAQELTDLQVDVNAKLKASNADEIAFVEELKQARLKAQEEENQKRLGYIADAQRFEELNAAINEEARRAILAATDPKVITTGTDKLKSDIAELIALTDKYYDGNLNNQSKIDKLNKISSDFEKQSIISINTLAVNAAQTRLAEGLKQAKLTADRLALVRTSIAEQEVAARTALEQQDLALSRVGTQQLVDELTGKERTDFAALSAHVEDILEDHKLDNIELARYKLVLEQLLPITSKLADLGFQSGKNSTLEVKFALSRLDNLQKSLSTQTLINEKSVEAQAIVGKLVEANKDLNREKVKSAEDITNELDRQKALIDSKIEEIRLGKQSATAKAEAIALLDTEREGLDTKVVTDLSDALSENYETVKSGLEEAKIAANSLNETVVELTGEGTKQIENQERINTLYREGNTLLEQRSKINWAANIPAFIPTTERLGGLAKHFALGGHGSDNIPAYLSRGEFVVNKSATEKFYSQLVGMNSGVRNFERGGSTTNFGNINISVASNGNTEADVIAIGKQLGRAIKSKRLGPLN